MEQARMLGLFPEMHDEVWEIVKANEEWSLMAEDLTGYYLQLESKLSTIQEITDQINKKNDTWSNGIRDAIDNYLQGTKTIRERWEQFTTTTLGAFEQGMVDIFDSATKGFENWAEVVTNMLSTIYNEMIRDMGSETIDFGYRRCIGRGSDYCKGSSHRNTNRPETIS
jgi:lambda family phage tail tape measure protein